MRKKILDVNVDFDLTMDDVMRVVENHINSLNSKSELLCTTNPYFIVGAMHDALFKNVLNNAILSVPDGVGVLYANYYLRNIQGLKRDFLFPLKAIFTGLGAGLLGYLNRKALGRTITGVDITDELCKLASQKGYTLFFLGGRPRDNKGRGVRTKYDMAEDAKRIMESKYPGLKVVGATSRFSRNAYDDKATLRCIKSCMKGYGIESIDILIVAYNPIEQEKWIARNSHKIPAKLSIGVGRVLDYITQSMSKPPKLIHDLHMGWFYAFVLQPWRIKRISVTFLIFPLMVFLNSIKTHQTSPEND